MLNLYAMPFSPFAMKVQYFLEETGIPYKYNPINLFDEAARKSLSAHSPFSKVPAIELNGFNLGESSAILRYLATRHELEAVFPTNLEDRAHVDMLMEFSNLHLNRWLNQLAFGLHFGPLFGMKTNQHAIDDARANLPDMLARFDKVIAGRKFLAGPNLTLADCTLLPFAASHKFAQVSLTDYPHMQAWVAHMTARPAWKKVEAFVQEAIKSMGK